MNAIECTEGGIEKGIKSGAEWAHESHSTSVAGTTPLERRRGQGATDSNSPGRHGPENSLATVRCLQRMAPTDQK